MAESITKWIHSVNTYDHESPISITEQITPILDMDSTGTDEPNSLSYMEITFKRAIIGRTATHTPFRRS